MSYEELASQLISAPQSKYQIGDTVWLIHNDCSTQATITAKSYAEYESGDGNFEWYYGLSCDTEDMWTGEEMFDSKDALIRFLLA